ncbi:MAG: hypothetical protein KDD50_04985 [Bdellovibrionales bacterium]|nr:hypothetical protein [Bdellovibrionales bacterium]
MKKVLKSFLLFVAALVLILTATELFYYITRSNEKAQAEATVRFKDECIRRNVDPNQFDGPKIRKLQGSSLEFRWDMKNEKKTILVLVEYLPHGTESWFDE